LVEIIEISWLRPVKSQLLLVKHVKNHMPTKSNQFFFIMLPIKQIPDKSPSNDWFDLRFLG
jgi:hypothetical protein